MAETSFRISLETPQTYHINLSEQVRHTIGLASPVPFGMAKLTIDTSSHWAERIDYVPIKGEIIVYSDRRIIDGIPYPGIKIGDGNAYAVDLPFVGDDFSGIITDIINSHINDTVMHISSSDRDNWNRKISCRIDGERLILEGSDL